MVALLSGLRSAARAAPSAHGGRRRSASLCVWRYVVLLVQALRGIPVVAPDAATLTQFAAWVVVTAAAAGLALRGAHASRQNAIN